MGVVPKRGAGLFFASGCSTSALRLRFRIVFLQFPHAGHPMARRSRSAFVLAALFASLALCGAQPASSSHALPAHEMGTERIVVGQSAFPLNGPLKFTTGDS